MREGAKKAIIHWHENSKGTLTHNCLPALCSRYKTVSYHTYQGQGMGYISQPLLICLFHYFFSNAFLESIANASGAFQSDNISRVLALCTKGKPLCVISEFPEFGDLFQFLRLHQASLPPSGGVQDQHNTSTSSKSSSITTATTSSEASSTGNNSVR